MEYASREHLLAIVESSRDAIISKDLNGVVTSWNRGAEAIFGYAASEMVGNSILRLIPDDRRDEEAWLLENIRRGERIELSETQRLARDGRLIDVALTLSPIVDADGRIIGASKIARDITPLKQREREIARLSRLYAALSQISQAIARNPERNELFREVCRALVEDGGFPMADIGWHDPDTLRIVPVAMSGEAIGADLQNVGIYGDERPEGCGLSATVLRTGRPYICNDILNDPCALPWRATLQMHGFRSLVSLPIRSQGQPCAVLNVYARQPGVFHDKEIALLEEVAAELSFGLDNILRDEARRQAERQLLSEKRFSDTMIESMPGIVYFFDTSGRFLRWNRNFEIVSGYSGSEISAMHPLDFFEGADRPLVEQRIGAVFEQGESSVAADFVTKDGSSIPYFFTGRRAELDGRVAMGGVGVDISARRHAERQLADSERKYRELVEYSNSIILRCDAAGSVIFINEYGRRFFGYSADEILGRHVIGTILPRDTGKDGNGDLVAQILAAPEAFEQNISENITRNGERVWIAWTNRVVHGAPGQASEILAIGIDITARKRAEEASRASESRYRTLFEYAPDGIVIADSHSYYLDANASMCRMLGYSRAEFIGLHASDILVSDELPYIEPTLKVINSKSDHKREWRFRRKDGSVFPAEAQATLMPDGNILGVIRDITDRKAVEAERERRHRAETADRIKSAFLAAMSHELRTPLNSIIGFTGIILKGLAGPLNDEQRKQLEMVRSSARHLLELVNDVLDISKIEAGQLDIARQRFDVRQSIHKTVSLMSPQAQAKGLSLTAQIDAEVGAMVNDERRFEQILLNLLSNAIKFTEHGTVTLQAQALSGFAFFGGPERPAIRVRVADTGIGIRSEDLELLFQPFQQIDSGLTRQHDGTGLGLAISHRLAVLMGGIISAESEWGKGSIFTVTLPTEPGVGENS